MTLSSTLNGSFACPGEVVFTCEIRGSQALAWSSDQYIGTGGSQIIFAAYTHNESTVRRSLTVPTTFAILTVNINQTQNMTLKSELHIFVLPNSPPASVTCHHIGDYLDNTTNFQIIGNF